MNTLSKMKVMSGYVLTVSITLCWKTQKKKKGVELNDEIIFPLEAKEDYGRIAAQTAKQVIIQRIREAERTSIIDEYGTKEGEIVTGIVQKIERGNVYVDFSRATGILPAEEQIPGEFFQRGQRVRAYLYSVEDSPRGINLRLSRTHPKFIEKLFAIEAPEIENGVVEIKSIAREAGARSKIAVHSNDEHIDPVGSCVGQKGTRVNTITQELLGEKLISSLGQTTRNNLFPIPFLRLKFYQ